MRSKSIHFILGISLLFSTNCKILEQIGILCPADEFITSVIDKNHLPFSETCEDKHQEDESCFCEQDFPNSDNFKFIKSPAVSSSLLLLNIIVVKTNLLNSFLKKELSIPSVSSVLLNSVYLVI